MSAPQKKLRAEWKPAVTFAEIAETLGIPSDLVMAASNFGGTGYQVFYTKEAEDELIWFADLRRDADGILVCFGDPIPQPGMWEGVKARIEEELG